MNLFSLLEIVKEVTLTEGMFAYKDVRRKISVPFDHGDLCLGLRYAYHGLILRCLHK